MHFVKRDEDIIIGKAFAEIFSLLGNITNTVKVVRFSKMPGAFETIINDVTTFSEATDYISVIDLNSDFKYLTIVSPSQDNSSLGWGILTDDNRLVLAVSEFSNVYLQFRPDI